MQATERALSHGAPCAVELRNFLPDAFSSECLATFAGWSLPTVVPLVGVVGYLLGKLVLDKACKTVDTTGTSRLFVALCYLHNVALCFFSMGVCIRSVSLVADSYSRVGFWDTYCSTPRSTLMADGFSFYVTVFYLSKCAPCPAPPCKCQLTQPCAAMLQTGSLLTRSS